MAEGTNATLLLAWLFETDIQESVGILLCQQVYGEQSVLKQLRD